MMQAGVTRDNWRTHPHSVWAFQNLAAFLPTATVPAGPTVRSLEGKPLDLARLEIAPGIFLDRFLELTHTDALLILHRGAIVFERYANGMRVDTPHMLFSVTKSVVGLVAELLIEQALLDEAQAAAHYVPEMSRSPFGRATLRSLLDMRDGIHFDENYADPAAQIHRYSASYWGQAPGGVRSALPGVGRAGSGDSFAYRTPVTDLIAWCIVRATGEPLATLVSELIWQPIGAERPAFFVRDTGGHEIAAAGLNATLRDVGRLAQMLVDRGRVDGAQAFSASVIDRITQGGDRAAFAAAGFETRPGWSYRSQWWVPPEPGTLCALGVYGQRVLIDMPNEIAVVRFGSHPVASNAATDQIHSAAMHALRRFLRMQKV
jgi:CubicO group peptidase (beta-lactamase class C family)